MKPKMAMIIFFSVFFIVYFLVNYYIYKHVSIVFLANNQVASLLKILFIAFIFSYPVGRILERLIPSLFTDVAIRVGSIWLAAMLYLILFFVLIDLGRLIIFILSRFQVVSISIIPNYVKLFTNFAVVVTPIILVFGYFNAFYPRVNQFELKVNKTFNNQSSLRIVAASDIHLGTVISNGRLSRFVNLVNAQKPDVILLAGDIFDEDLGPVIKKDMGKLLSKLEAPMGVYAVTGNHEYIGGVSQAVKYLKDHGITVLQDSVAVTEMFNIVGRDDRQSKVMGGKPRKELASFMQNVNLNKFTVLLDHQPYHLNEAVENGIDLQISGHTHHGQLWPLSYITKSIFEVSRGYKKKDNTHIIVSTGYGTWGPPIRIGNRPEILLIDITTN